MKKECCSCLQYKDATIEFFGVNKQRKDGLQKYCSSCSRMKDRNHYLNSSTRRDGIRDANNQARRRNRIYLWEYLKTHPCVDCGENNPFVLEFDHVLGEKRTAVSILARRAPASIKTLQSEIDKCQIRCANCHRIKTAKQLGWYADLI